MPPILANPPMTTPDKGLVSPRPKPAKAALPDNLRQDALSTVVLDAVKRSHGKQGAAAAALGKDEGNFSRDVKAGAMRLQDLKKLGPEFLGELGAGLVEQYGALTHPRERARQVTREIKSLADELDQFLEHLA